VSRIGHLARVGGFDMAGTYCMSCGAIRVGDARFCGTCGHPFDAGLPSTAAPSGDANTAKMVAGLAWIGCAALTAYLGFIQLGYVGTVLDEGSLSATAIWNLIAGALTLFFGARLLTNADRGFLGTSVAWAILFVVWDAYQIANGVTHWAYIGSTVAALVAGVMSYVARQSMAAPPPLTPGTSWGPGWEIPPTATATAPATPTAWPQPAVIPTAVEAAPTAADRDPRRGRRVAPAVVVAVVLAVVAGAVAVFVLTVLSVRTVAPSHALATARATTAPTADPGPLVLDVGETVDLSNPTLGSLAVIDTGSPKAIAGDKLAKGKRYVAAKVRYDALAAWQYSPDDWSLSDADGVAYKPLDVAPKPALADGVLQLDEAVEGWVAFEVPTDADGLSMNLVARDDGSVVVTVPIP
jgi:hypothetical protein